MLQRGGGHAMVWVYKKEVTSAGWVTLLYRYISLHGCESAKELCLSTSQRANEPSSKSPLHSTPLLQVSNSQQQPSNITFSRRPSCIDLDSALRRVHSLCSPASGTCLLVLVLSISSFNIRGPFRHACYYPSLEAQEQQLHLYPPAATLHLQWPGSPG
jgi:hypothetical protein